ncbi:excalibur calcium-binding domain-containing protein [uncultured Pseudoteredinibacter sp.]|uniref:excalibur calcium-binding domain-containing protein n=1 Tax=uncultured Pseudoteredinibacter sp. TaxID=1641701 RepID=UPI00262BDDB1|nr:excalibur calcium-binding domain-containing protein [uncultured Pseudoteredinibacter sp.]
MKRYNKVLLGRKAILVFKFFISALLLLVSCTATADNNLATCLKGKYPSLCKKHLLTEAEKSQVLKAEKRENLKICLVGKYPRLCKQHLLTQIEKEQVLQAEKRENLKICLVGKYPSLCKRHLLTQTEKEQVLQAEKRENNKICLVRKYPSLCKQQLLTQSEKEQVQKAKKQENHNNYFYESAPDIVQAESQQPHSIPSIQSAYSSPSFNYELNTEGSNGIKNIYNSSTKYYCQNLTASEANNLYLAGHTYLDADSDGIPCEWESSKYSSGETYSTKAYSPPSYSGNCHYVSGYTRKNGTYVSGYTRCR